MKKNVLYRNAPTGPYMQPGSDQPISRQDCLRSSHASWVHWQSAKQGLPLPLL